MGPGIIVRVKDECPFCGEPIDSEAQVCPHCGSDAETGWNPDSDYESVEIPEDDLVPVPLAPSVDQLARQIRAFMGPAVVFAAWIFFIAVGSLIYKPPPLVLIPALYLAVCVFVLHRLAPRRQVEARRTAPPGAQNPAELQDT